LAIYLTLLVLSSEMLCLSLAWSFVQHIKMGKKEAGKPRGRMTPYACFVQVSREEQKKKHPNESIVFAEFSKKCAEKWKVSRQ
jgi:hypothetical protein